MDKQNKKKVFSFYIDDAIKWGSDAATLLFNIRFWLDKNVANNTHIYEGRVWTYNSVSAFSQLFPHLTDRQINYNLTKLQKVGILVVGNFNKKGYDRTKWYSVNEAEYIVDEAILQNCKMDLQNCKMDRTKMENGSYENVKPIPDINADINTDHKSHIVNRKPESWLEASSMGMSAEEYLRL